MDAASILGVTPLESTESRLEGHSLISGSMRSVSAVEQLSSS